MFTGIIEEIGTVRRIERGAKGARLTIGAHTVLEGTKIGDSIATNGVCLTVTAMTADSFSADVMAESLRRSGLGALQTGAPVNLERAMPACGPLWRAHRLRPHRRHRHGHVPPAGGQRRVADRAHPRPPAAVHC